MIYTTRVATSKGGDYVAIYTDEGSLRIEYFMSYGGTSSSTLARYTDNSNTLANDRVSWEHLEELI